MRPKTIGVDVPMSTPLPPEIASQPPKTASEGPVRPMGKTAGDPRVTASKPSLSAKHNPENMLPSQAFHGSRR